MPACMPSFTNGAPSLAAGGGVPDVAGQRQAQPGADRGAVDRGDGRHLERPDRQPGPVERRSSGSRSWSTVASGSLAIQDGVAAGAERASPRPVTTTARTERSAASWSMARDPGGGHLVGHRVALLGVVEGEQGDAVGGAFEAQVGAGMRAGY